MPVNLLQNAMRQISGGDNSVSSVSAVDKLASRQLQAQMKSEILGMLPGSTIQGQLVSKEGSNAQLLLNNILLLETQIDSEANLGLNSQMTFQIQSNQFGQLTLRPLFSNLANSETITKALDAAGLPATDTNVAMVNSLMEEGLPINKEVLNLVSRELGNYPEADVRDIVMLHKMDIPVNDTNVSQMHQYMNNSQYMLESIEVMADDLTDMLTQLAENDPDGFVNLTDGLMQAFSESAEIGDGNSFANEQAVLNNNADILMQNVKEDNDTGAGQSGVQGINSDDKTSTVLAQNESELTEGNITNKDVSTNMNNEQSLSKASVTSNEGMASDNKFFDMLRELTSEQLKNPQIREAVRDSLTKIMENKLLMDPKEFGKEEYVKKYYNRLSNIAEDISKIMESIGKTESVLAKTAEGVKENVQFMNQMNELYNYVQLPLKLNEAQANGDLYVYTKKRGGKMSPDEKLTALLHLSMETLGNMDIFLTLQNEKLSTKFCLEKEEMIDFIDSHIDELNKRLIKKGYNVVTTVGQLENKEESTIDRIVNEEKVVLLSTQSFDARC